MIIFVNGPFGVGKTTAARLLVQRLPGARLYDPERAGWLLRRLSWPFRRVADYQDLALWRLSVPLGAWLLSRGGRRTLVAPMTVWRPDHHAGFIAGLRRIDHDVRPIQLTAPEAVLRARILGRPDNEGGHAWCLSHLPACLAMANDPAFGAVVQTGGHTPAEVADAIMAVMGSGESGVGGGFFRPTPDSRLPTPWIMARVLDTCQTRETAGPGHTYRVQSSVERAHAFRQPRHSEPAVW